MTPTTDLNKLRSEGDINLSPARRAWQHANLDQAAIDMLAEDATWFLHQSLSTPCLNTLTGCEGIYLRDGQGRTIMDFHGNNVHQVGYGNPKVIDAIVRQMTEMPFCPRRFTNRPAIALAERLAKLAPGRLKKVLLAPGGTSAIGMALKLARVATGRHKTISMWDSFHGASLDAISIGGESVFRAGIGPLLSGCEHVPPPDARHCPWDCKGDCTLKCADYIEYVLEKEGDVAAVIAETVRCTPFVPPKDYWRRVRAACDRHGALLILDEIPTGLGRTGKMFVCEHYEVEPDMLVLGKGLGGGIFPIAALIARVDLDVAKDKALGHYTHEKNPVACAAALATLDCLEQDDLVGNAARVGAFALERLKVMAEATPCLAAPRGLGLLLGIEVVRDKQTMARDPERAERIMYASMARGLSFKLTMGNIVTLTPALTIKEAQMTEALDILGAAVQESATTQP